MRIYRESLRKEGAHQNVYESFAVNDPRKMGFFAEKPNNNPFLLIQYRNEGRTINGVDIDELLDDETKKATLTAELSERLKTVTHVPRDKWP